MMMMMMMKHLTLVNTILLLSFSLPLHTHSSLLSEPIEPNTVPSIPLQNDSSSQQSSCHLDLSDELFGGVTEACSHSLDRSRCCPVLAAWLYAAHARSALKLPRGAHPPVSPDSDLPMMPDSDSQKCVNSLQNSLLQRNIKLPQPNATCDTVLCFCGIRLHQIASLSCPSVFVFNTSGSGGGVHKNVTPTEGVKSLEKSCRNSSYSGCTKCLGALEKLKGGDKKGRNELDGRASKMFNRDCQLMGLTWLLAHNKTAYIPTVSAVLRAIMYSAHQPHHSKCSPDQENMPLAVDSLQFHTSFSSPPFISFSTFTISLFLVIFLL